MRAVLRVCCSHMDESALTGSPVILEHTFTVRCRQVLCCKQRIILRTGNGESEETLEIGEGEHPEDVLADPKAIEFAPEILPLLTSL